MSCINQVLKFGVVLTVRWKWTWKYLLFARAGDSFTLELPPELKLSHVANPNVAWSTVSANGKVIAKVYHEKDNLIRFVLTTEAYSVQEYNGWFEIGVPTSNVIKINNRETTELYKTGCFQTFPSGIQRLLAIRHWLIRNWASNPLIMEMEWIVKNDTSRWKIRCYK